MVVKGVWWWQGKSVAEVGGEEKRTRLEERVSEWVG